MAEPTAAERADDASAAARPPGLDRAPSAAPSTAVRRAQRTTVTLVLVLAVLLVAWEAWLAPTGRGTLVVKALPLLLPLPGMLRHRLNSFRALSLGIWAYAFEGAIRGYAPSQASNPWTPVLAWLEVALALVIFWATVRYIKQRFADGRARMAASGTA